MRTSPHRWFRRHAALPDEHGSWVLFLGPLAIGTAVAPQRSSASALFALAALAAFLARQPLTLAVKVACGRRGQDALGPALLWLGVYVAAGTVAAAALVRRGLGLVLWLALPGLAVLAWQLVLVARRDERGRLVLDLAGAAALSLAATGAWWVGAGGAQARGLVLAALVLAQAGAAIAHAALRLGQRELSRIPRWPERLARGRASLAASFGALGAVAVACGMALLPPWLWVPYALQALEALHGVARPACGLRPRAIGWRQLAVSALFTLLFVLAWRLR